MKSTHGHPNPGWHRLTQSGALALLVVMLAAVAGQIIIGLLDARFLLFVLSGLFTLALTPAVLLATVATPPVTIAPEGLTIQPVIWRERFVPWSAVRAVKDYPLLPPSDAEVGRRLMVGRLKYRPAEGKMLLIADLPRIYRVTGFFTGEGLTPVIAVTNRTHAEYAKLLHKIEIYVSEVEAGDDVQ